MTDLNHLPADMFLADSVKAELQKAVEIYSKVQNALFADAEDESDGGGNKLRIGTVMIFAVVNRLNVSG